MNELNKTNEEVQEAAKSLPSASTYVTDEIIKDYIGTQSLVDLYGVLDAEDEGVYPDENEMRGDAEYLLEIHVPEDVEFTKEDEEEVYQRCYAEALRVAPSLKDYWSEIMERDDY